MAAPLFRAYLAISADGFIARADGSFDWLLNYDPAEFGYADFITGIGCVVMGRDTYHSIRGMGGDWPYAGKRCYVITSRPIADLPPATETRPADFAALAAELRQYQDGDVWLLGGSRTWAGFLAAGALDRFELYVIPMLIGEGIPLLPPQQRRDLSLRLLESEPLAKGVVKLIYAVG